MTNVELLHRDTVPLLRTVRAEVEAESNVYWCHMHPLPRPGEPATRPCFSAGLLNDLAAMQGWTARRIERVCAESDEEPLSHLVLASDQSVFNLGGDLALFAQLIRGRDRASLLAYARRCIDVAVGFHRLTEAPVHSIAVVQGDALGGGFEAALCCNTLIAEEGTGMGFPEVLFDLFPGMGAFSFLSRRIAPAQAERMMLDGHVHAAEDLHRMGVVDLLVPRGAGIDAALEVIRRNRRIPSARRAMRTVRDLCQPVPRAELDAITEVWVDTALGLGDKALATMERLVRAQLKRFVAKPDAGTDAAAIA
jgi:DSF synthase